MVDDRVSEYYLSCVNKLDLGSLGVDIVVLTMWVKFYDYSHFCVFGHTYYLENRSKQASEQTG